MIVAKNYDRGQRGQPQRTEKRSCGCSNCSTLFLFLLVITSLMLCMANFWITLHRYEQVKQSLRYTQETANITYMDLVNQVNDKTSRLKAKHDSDIAIVEEAYKKSTSEVKKSKELELIRETRDSFGLAIRELNSKVAQIDNGNQVNSQVLDTVKAAMEKMAAALGNHQGLVEDLQSKVDHMLAEALASAALATSISNSTGGASEAILAALSKEASRRLELEETVKKLEKAATEEQSKRVTIMDELIRAEQSSMQRLEETDKRLRKIDQVHHGIETVFVDKLKNQTDFMESLRQQVTELNLSLHTKMESMINEWNGKLDELQSTLKLDRENALMRIQKNWEERLVANATTSDSSNHLKNEVAQLRGRVDYFVQSLMKVLRLPGLIRDLETRMEALEAV